MEPEEREAQIPSYTNSFEWRDGEEMERKERLAERERDVDGALCRSFGLRDGESWETVERKAGLKDKKKVERMTGGEVERRERC